MYEYFWNNHQLKIKRLDDQIIYNSSVTFKPKSLNRIK
jgi:hypothetical protein